MLKNYIKRLLIFSSLIFAVAYLLFEFALPQYYLVIFPFLILFFAVTTIIVHVVLTKAGTKKFSRFSTLFIGSISAKLFIYFIFIIAYIIIDEDTAKPFLITFLVLYFFYTFFETYFLLRDLKKQGT